MKITLVIHYFWHRGRMTKSRYRGNQYVQCSCGKGWWV